MQGVASGRAAFSRGGTPSAAPSHLRRATAAALSVARRGEGLEGEELLWHKGWRSVKRLVDATTPAQAALQVGLPAQRRVGHADRGDTPQTEARHLTHENEPEPPLDGGGDEAARLLC